MTDDERLSLALPFRFEGRLRYLLARMDFSLEDGELVTDNRDRILTFASPEAALAFSATCFPEVPATTSDQEELAALRRGLEEMYAPAVHLYELDAAAEWARQPAGPRPDPRILLETWRLLAWAEVAPEPARYDPMGLPGMHMNQPRDARDREAIELIEAGMMLGGIVRERERRLNRGDTLDDQWREYDEMWTPAVSARVAGIIVAGLPALAARLKDSGS